MANGPACTEQGLPDRCLEGTARVSSMVAELVSLDRLIWIGISKSGIVGVSRGCQFALAAWDIPLVSGWW